MSNSFIESVKTMMNTKIEKAGYDKTRTGQIVKVNDNNTYSVQIGGWTYPNVITVNDITYNLYDVVKVVIPCNQATQMYITSSILSDNSMGKKVAYATTIAENADDKATEANNKAIEADDKATEANNKAIEANNKVTEAIVNLYKVTDYTVSIANIDAYGNILPVDYNITRENGYRAIGIVGYNNTDTNIQATTNYVTDNAIDSNPILTVGFFNNGSSALINQTATFKILWIKATV